LADSCQSDTLGQGGLLYVLWFMFLDAINHLTALIYEEFRCKSL